MKVSLRTRINLPPEIVWKEVQTARLLILIAWPLMRFEPVGDQPFTSFQAGGRYEVKLRLFGIIPFGKQWIVTSTHEPDAATWPKVLRDDGYSALIDKWDHWITVSPGKGGGTDYLDEVEISAGPLTPIIWGFAQLFYRHRQRRWRGLAQTLHARRLIDAEMGRFEAARATGDVAQAWVALERAHIVSQPYLGPHVANHWAMLRYAFERCDWRETGGQVLRIALAPLGALTGRIPIGNTGRSNVSAFKPMLIADDLLAKLNEVSK